MEGNDVNDEEITTEMKKKQQKKTESHHFRVGYTNDWIEIILNPFEKKNKSSRK